MKLKDIKNWNQEVDQSIKIEKEKFNFNPKTNKNIYSIDTPPPYVNNPIHIGQAITYCYMDFFARYKRMKGFEVIFPLGLDNNGLPIELGAEKKYNISPFKIGRDKFIEYCKKLLEEAGTETTDTFSKLGISFTSYKESDNIGALYQTDSKEYRTLTQNTFIDLFKKNLVYEANYLTNWDPKLQTAIADSEITREEKETDLNYVKFKIKNSQKHIIIATTRPELLCTAALIIYNPKDKRYKDLKGKSAITPIFNIEVPIIEHNEADPEFGSGLVFMSKGAGDQDAIRFLREMKITPVSAIGMDGKINEHGGFLKGLSTREARLKIIEEIKKKGLMEKQEKIMHSVPISERSKSEIEFVSTKEFYIKQITFKKEMKKISNSLNWYPKSAKKILDDWIESVSIDWPISRRRFYATPIPLWHSNNKIALPPEGKYYEPWKQSPPENSEVYQNGKKIGALKEFKNESWVGETRVFDTWMDSSISELYILKYKSNKELFKKAYPANLRPQGKEIIRTWLYYTLLRGYLETEKPCFKDVWINQHIVDENGRKMSKSLGNGIDPQMLLKKYGSEVIRFWSVIEGDLSKQDLKCSEEKIKAELKTMTKILNVAKFVSMFTKPKSVPKLTKTDQLFIDYMEELTKESDKSYNLYDFHHPALKLRDFIWEIFASHYIELVKARAYNQENTFSNEESESAKYTLHHLMERFLILSYPIIPKITNLIAKEKNLDLDKIEFPKYSKVTKGKSNLELINKIKEFNSLIWKMKKEKNISLRDSIEGIKIPKDLDAFKKDLIACHKI